MNSAGTLNNESVGYVYLIEHVNSRGLVKIGKTVRPDDRAKQLGGEDLTIHCRVLVADHHKFEKELHDFYAESRLTRESEWFDLTSDEREQCIAKMCTEQEKLLSESVRPDRYTYEWMRDACQQAHQELEEARANLLGIVDECRQQMRAQFKEYREQQDAQIQHWMNGFADKLMKIEQLESQQKKDSYKLTQLRARVEHLERKLQQADPWQYKREYRAPEVS